MATGGGVESELKLTVGSDCGVSSEGSVTAKGRSACNGDVACACAAIDEELALIDAGRAGINVRAEEGDTSRAGLGKRERAGARIGIVGDHTLEIAARGAAVADREGDGACAVVGDRAACAGEIAHRHGGDVVEV